MHLKNIFIIVLLFFFLSILTFSQETQALDVYEKAVKNIFDTIKDKTPDLKTKYAIKMVEYKHKIFFETLKKFQDKDNVETLKRLYCSHFADKIIEPLEKEGYKISFRIQHPLGKVTAITVTFGLARVGEYYIEDKCQKEMTEFLSKMQNLSQKVDYSEHKNRTGRTSWQNTQIDRKFYERHPEMHGQRLDPHNPNHKEYIKDWVNIAKESNKK